ncbi:unnamed protein product [Hymenolepis diminuta]|uniref:DUF7041 domain-containing protein n=1 Tax=Hymenolepis diminuta TaxID=6216 RepID=A0A564YAV5_HYMDI|nr:unnamed protein product [Hymenolepis diminuta]
MFQQNFYALPIDVAAQVIDILDKTPEENSYDAFKGTVISRLSNPQEKRVQQLLSCRTWKPHSFLTSPSRAIPP